MKIPKSRKGILLKDGFYCVINPKTQKTSVISISKGKVYIHDITRKMSLEDLVRLDKTNYLEVFVAFDLKDK